MSHYIEVETGLEEIKMALVAQGYHVIDMNQRVFPVNAVIYTGPVMEKPRTPISHTGQDTLLYNAAGQTPEEVVGHIGEIFN